MAVKKIVAQKQARKQYEPGTIEPSVRGMWEKGKIFSPNLDTPTLRQDFDGELSRTAQGKPYYNLMMFPYPSAEGLHVGNMYAFTGSDIWGRYQRMRGNDVFEPIGLDGFGIHSENYAIKIGEHPKKVAERTEKHFYEQLHATGNSFDWTRTLETYDPDYYKWTQWLFVQMFKNGLAYREKATVNWCPSCKTVLADEQVIDDHCERCTTKVELKKLEQWFFKITDYADRLLDGLDKIDWPERIKIAQRNWIGRSVGSQVAFPVYGGPAGEHRVIKVFTTRPDTLFGATFVVVSPELAQEWLDAGWQLSKEARDYVEKALVNRKARGPGENEKTGVFSGIHAVNPVNKEKIPVWIADYVLAGYGTGAIMAVPAHDERDWEFAKKYKLAIKHVIKPRGGVKDEVYIGHGEVVNSGDWNGLKVPEDLEKISKWLYRHHKVVQNVSYHLRDWLISRQRYWGPPIPMIYCQECAKQGRSWFNTAEANDFRRKTSSEIALMWLNVPGWGVSGWYPVPEGDLPVELPYIEDYQPRGLGESPLAQDPSFVRVNCPSCGKTARRETDVSDTFLDSAWYFLRYLATDSDKAPFPSGKWKMPLGPELGVEGENGNSLAKRESWLPVAMYIGGAEHSVLHLMYVRFVTMALHDWGYLPFQEPFPRFYAHGLLISEGAKMSKSKGNVVVPDEYIKKYGADTLRMYLMFLGPFDQGGDFRDTGIEGMFKFIRRVWGLVLETQSLVLIEESDSREVLQKIHQTIKRVTEDMEGLRYNRAIAGIMEYVNFLKEVQSKSKSKSKTGIRCAEWDEVLRTLVLLLAPFAPHITEELWQRLRKWEVRDGKLDKEVGSARSHITRQSEASPASHFQLHTSVHFQAWPKFDPELAQEEFVEIPIQVNGKLRGTVKVGRDEASKQGIVEKQAREVAQKYLVGVKKVVFVPGRLINFVV